MPTKRVKERGTDPRHISVQLNISVPWSFREFLIQRATKEEISLNQLVLKAIRGEALGAEYDRAEAKYAKEQIELTKRIRNELGETWVS